MNNSDPKKTSLPNGQAPASQPEAVSPEEKKQEAEISAGQQPQSQPKE